MKVTTLFYKVRTIFIDVTLEYPGLPGDVVGDVDDLLLAGVEAETPHGAGQLAGLDGARVLLAPLQPAEHARHLESRGQYYI